MGFKSLKLEVPPPEPGRESVEINLEEIEKKAQETLKLLREKPIIKEVLERLKTELPPGLAYHNAEHTDDVLGEAILLAIYDNLPKEDVELLAIAAAYHDSGFIKRPNLNEEIGARIAAEAMEKYSYSADKIKIVAEAIEDTQVRMTKKGLNQIVKGRNKTSDYLLDADVANFGREDFKEKVDLVFKESKILDRREFLAGTFNFLINHSWKTEAAKKLRQPQKEKNIAALRYGLNSQ